MGAREKISELCSFLGRIYESKRKRQQEVLDFLSWSIINIPENVRKQIGTIDNVTENYKGKNYGIDLTLKDYNYWKNEIAQHSDICFCPVAKIEKRVLNKVVELSTNEYIESKEALEDIIKQINEVYA